MGSCHHLHRVLMDDNVLIAFSLSLYSDPTICMFPLDNELVKCWHLSTRRERSILPIMTGAFSDRDLSWRAAVSTWKWSSSQITQKLCFSILLWERAEQCDVSLFSCEREQTSVWCVSPLLWERADQCDVSLLSCEREQTSVWCVSPLLSLHLPPATSPWRGWATHCKLAFWQPRAGKT